MIERLQVFKYGQPIRKDGPEAHLKKTGTPTMGGLLILAAIFVSTGLWSDVKHQGMWLLLLVTMGYGAVGFYDDYKKIKYKNPDGLDGKWKSLVSKPGWGKWSPPSMLTDTTFGPAP
jgi:phospho-N-acetylmuramoyl-pentapeptide-transferase